MKDELCHCGKPLHYANSHTERLVKELIAAVGDPYIPITAHGRIWRVQRHYIALHGIKADELHTLGFEEITH